MRQITFILTNKEKINFNTSLTSFVLNQEQPFGIEYRKNVRQHFRKPKLMNGGTMLIVYLLKDLQQIFILFGKLKIMGFYMGMKIKNGKHYKIFNNRGHIINQKR